jgi:hypothetical protein
MRVGIHVNEALIRLWVIDIVCNLMYNEYKRVCMVKPLKLKRETAGVACTMAADVSRTTVRYQ